VGVFYTLGGSNPPLTAIKLNQKPVIIYGRSR